MKIIVANEIGFCFGVKRAIDMALDAAKQGVYTLGELVHNETVIEYLGQRGIVSQPDMEAIPQDATVLIRSHGIPPKAREKLYARFNNVLDATCPFVERIHEIVTRVYKEGAHVLIIGDKDHAECVGINGCCDNGADFIYSFDEALEYAPWEGRLCVVTQTTFSVEEDRRIREVLAKKKPDTEFYATVCSTTSKRQQEAEELSRKCTAMVVIGSGSSSNTTKLAAVCKKNCKRIQSVAKQSELALEKFKCNDIIGVVAGASAPDWIIMEVITRMSELEKTMAEKASPVENSEVETGASATVKPEVTEKPAEAANTREEETSFAEAFEGTLVRIRNGQILTGTVLQIVDGEVSVNIGYKSDGVIRRDEFSSDPDVDPSSAVKVGDSIEVEVLKVNDGEGNVQLSRKNVESKKVWDKLAADEDIENKVFDGVGKEVVKGGLIATIEGVRAFVPASQLSTKYVENIGEFVGKPLKLKVIDVDKARKRIVASHKAVMIVEAEEAKKQKWAELVVGSKVNGTVRRLTDFGAFVDIGGIDGLVHVTDVAWGRVKNPGDVLSVGQEIEVLIRDVDVEKQRVSLGYKQLQPKPWTMAADKYPVGSVVEGKVVRIVPFGAFVALEPTIDGLIHISQVGVKRIAKVEDEINVGDMVRCKVLDVNPEAKRISLSRREVVLEENPEIAEELAKEREERERMAAERAEQRQAAAEQTKQASSQSDRPERTERTERPARRDRSDRGDRPERSRREDSDYELPPVESATTSLADKFAGFKEN